MPEQLTKHPEVTIEVLRSAGAKCAEGTRPEILKECPAARFCQLPGGEVCVYGLGEAAQMTQITQADWRALRVGLNEGIPGYQTVPLGTLFIAMLLSVAAGALLCSGVNSLRRRRRLRRGEHM